MTPEAMKEFCKALAVVMFVVGAFGSLLCVPYAIGFSLPWIVTAGIYFIAGAVLMAGGLVSYSYLSTQK